MSIAISIALPILLSAPVVFYVMRTLRKAGAFGPTKAQQERIARLTTSGVKGRATIVSIQPTGMVVNEVNVQCNVGFRIQPLDGALAFDATKVCLIAQTSMPRLGDVWLCWFDAVDHSQFVVAMTTALGPDQEAVFREFGIALPHV